jgi:hypothetical protein
MVFRGSRKIATSLRSSATSATPYSAPKNAANIAKPQSQGGAQETVPEENDRRGQTHCKNYVGTQDEFPIQFQRRTSPDGDCRRPLHEIVEIGVAVSPQDFRRDRRLALVGVRGVAICRAQSRINGVASSGGDKKSRNRRYGGNAQPRCERRGGGAGEQIPQRFKDAHGVTR